MPKKNQGAAVVTLSKEELAARVAAVQAERAQAGQPAAPAAAALSAALTSAGLPAEGTTGAAAGASFAEGQATLRAQILTSYRNSVLRDLTSAYLECGALCWRYLDNAIKAHGAGAGTAHGKTWTEGAKELGELITAETGDEAPNVSRMVGFYALGLVWGMDTVKGLPFSTVRALLPLIKRDDTAPGLEYVTPTSAPGKVLAYAIQEEYKEGALALLAELEKGARPTYKVLTERVEKIRGGKGRGRSAKKAKKGKKGKVAPESGPIADAVKRFKLALDGKDVKAQTDGRRTVIKKAVAQHVLTASDLSSAILAIGEDDARPARERLNELRLVLQTLRDSMDALKLAAVAERQTVKAPDVNADVKAAAAAK
jgi:hypothetical protein